MATAAETGKFLNQAGPASGLPAPISDLPSFPLGAGGEGCSAPCVVGTLINAGAIVAGGVLGTLLRREPSPRVQLFLKTLLGVLTLYIGFRTVWMGIGGSFGRVLLQLAMAMLALVLGNAAGKLLGIQNRFNKLGRYAADRYREAQKEGRPRFNDGFVACSILFCAAPLAILGAFQEGFQGDPRVLVVKAGIDGFSAAAFVRVFGLGATLSCLPVLAYQGTLTLLTAMTRPAMQPPAMLDGLEVVTGMMVAMCSLTIFEVRKVPLADYLPALLLAPVFRLLVS